MNEELIQKLVDQCVDKRERHGTTVEVLQSRKFAELIVQECMACSTWVGKMNTNSGEPIHTAHAINQRIKQHFGVEE